MNSPTDQGSKLGPWKSLVLTRTEKYTTSSLLLNAYITPPLPPFLNAAASGYNPIPQAGQTDSAVRLDDTWEVSKPPLSSCIVRSCTTLGPTINHRWEIYLLHVILPTETVQQPSTIHHNTYLENLGAATGRNHVLYAATIVTRCISEGNYWLGVKEHT